MAAEALVTAEMLKPIADGIVASAKIIVPVGVGIMGTLVGVKIIPAIIYKFL